MPVGEHLDGAHRQRIVRRVVSVRGHMRFHMHMEPRFNYARDDHEVNLHEHGAVFRSRDMTMALESTVPLKVVAGTAVSASFSLNENESATFLLEQVPDDFIPRHHHHDETRRMFDGTVALLAQVAQPVRLPRALARDGQPFRPDAQAADLPPHRRHRGGADHEPARAARRPAQLGLPLHLDSRRRLLAVCAAAPGLHRGGAGVHGVAHGPLPRRQAARRGRGTAADHVRHRRPRASSRRSSWTTSRATGARPPCASGTAPPTSSSSTSTAS